MEKSRKDISFLIPTNRPHKLFLNRTLDAIQSYNSLGYDYEILVSTTTAAKDTKNIKYFLDKENEGSIAPINFLASQACGDYLCVLVDDYLPSSNLFSVINFLKSPIYDDRRFKITSLSVTVGPPGRMYRLPSERVPPAVIHPKTGSSLKHNRNFIMKFPTMSRETYDLLGKNIFHPHFIHHVADNYLSIYIGNMGEETIENSEVSLWDWAGRNARTTYDVYDMTVLYYLVEKLSNKYYYKDIRFNSIEEMKNFYLSKEE